MFHIFNYFSFSKISFVILLISRGVLPLSQSNVDSIDFQTTEKNNNSKCNSKCDSLSFMGFLSEQIKNQNGERFPRELTRRTLEKPPSSTKLFNDLFSKRLFNTTMNFIVPGVKVNLPHNSQQGSLIHLAMQAFFGIFWAVAWISIIAVPAALTYFQPFGLGRSFGDSDDKYNFHFKWRLSGRLVEDIGLNGTLCLQKTICQAHESPKYGVLGKIIRFLFPVPNDISSSPLSSSPFLGPARHGAIGHHDCGHIYKCFFDILDMVFYISDHSFASFST